MTLVREWTTNFRNGVNGYPELLVAAGALCLSVSPLLVLLSATSPATAAFFRCVLALPVLVPLAVAETRRVGPFGRRGALVALVAGMLFGGELLLWHEAIGDVGAGLSTVVVNVQVVIVPLLAWLFGRERVPGRFLVTAPLMLAGVALTAGLGSTAAFGRDPVRGVLLAVTGAVSYAGYLFLLRRVGGTGHVITPVCHATVGAAVPALLLGDAFGGLDLTPDWPALGWLALLALSGQVGGWLLVAAALPRLPASVGSTVLLLQPVLAVVLGMIVLGERPAAPQLLGCALVMIGVYVTVVRRRSPLGRLGWPAWSTASSRGTGGTPPRPTSG